MVFRKYSFFLYILVFFGSRSFNFASDSTHSAYIAPIIKGTTLAGIGCPVFGLRGAWVIDKHIVIGAEYDKLISPFTTYDKYSFDLKSNTYPHLDFSCGGLFLEYIFFPEKLFHVTIGIMCAGGGLRYIPVVDNNLPHASYFSANMLVWEPSISIETNTLKWMNLGVNLGYRDITAFGPFYGIQQNEVSGIVYGLFLKIGSY